MYNKVREKIEIQMKQEERDQCIPYYNPIPRKKKKSHP